MSTKVRRNTSMDSGGKKGGVGLANKGVAGGIGTLLQRRATEPRRTMVLNFRGTRNDPLGEERENRNMEMAEREQCSSSDRFWGIDKEAQDTAEEQVLMAKEHDYSSAHEAFCKTLLLHEDWEREYQQQCHEEAYNSAVGEMHQRRAYMRSLFMSSSSEDIMAYRWKSQVRVLHTPQIGMTEQRVEHLNGASNNVYSSNNMEQQPLSAAAASASSVFLLPPVDPVARLSLHLEGMQQARALASGHGDRSSAADLREPLRSRTQTPNVIESAMLTPSRKKKNTNTNDSSVPATVAGGIQLTTDTHKNTLVLTTQAGNTMILPPLPEAKHIEALDGHTTHKWDQEVLLQSAFSLLDATKSGLLSPNDISRVANDGDVQALLRFTVLGSWIKTKKWNAFLSIFASAGQSSIDVNDWMSAAYNAAEESFVPACWIRTDEQHREIVLSKENGASSQPVWLRSKEVKDEDRRQRDWFAAQTRSRLYNNEREVALKRELVAGDIVWSLHGGGVVWLPAFVVANHEEGDTFDLSYPLSAQALILQREAVNARKLVTAIQKESLLDLRKNGGKMLAEVGLCDRAYELIANTVADVDKISMPLIISCLLTQDLQPICKASAILSVIAPASTSCVVEEEGQEPVLSPTALVMMDAFPSDTTVSKAQFIACCTSLSDVLRNNIHQGHRLR